MKNQSTQMTDPPRLVNVANGQNIEINADKFSVGRSLKCNYVLNSVYISRTHFILEKNNGRWILRDNSSNGTLLNSHMINYGNTKNLNDGDLIKLINADTEFRFELFPNDNFSITDQQLCEALDSVIYVKNEVSEENVLNDHCYDGQSSIEQPFINEVIVSEEERNPTSDSIIPMPPESSSSNSDISNQRKRSSSPENVASTQEPDESPSKKNKTNATDSESNLEAEKNSFKVPDKGKKETANNFDMVEEEMQCSICSELFIKAVTLNCCHTFCLYCINQWKKQQLCCPICRKTITGMAPTLVLDNFIEKHVSIMDEETKKQRRDMIDFRLSAENAPKGSAPSTSKNSVQSTTSSLTTSTTATSHTTVTISSDDDDDDDYTDDYTDEDEYYDHYSNYNGVRGKYYGGYGRCYNCNRIGHWANGCPYR